MSDDDRVSVDMTIRALTAAVEDLSDKTFDKEAFAELTANRSAIMAASEELAGIVGLIHFRLAQAVA